MNKEIEDKIKEISNEAVILTEKREVLTSEIKSVDIRLTQIIGAIQALSDLLKQD